MESFAFYSFITLLVMVNPLEAAAAFETLTVDDTEQEQSAVARKATISAGIILVGFGFIGELLLRSLGISYPAFRIAGGILLFSVGFNMVFAQQTQRDEADKPASRMRPDPSVFPLGIPIITGPGALTAAVTLWTRAYERRQPIIALAILLIIAAVVFGLTYIAMRGAQRLTKTLGATGVDAVGRVLGIIVAAIAVQLVIESAQQLMPSLVRHIAPG